MKLDELTIGEAKQLAAMFSGVSTIPAANPMIGKFCIARCYSAGVHAGIVESVDGENVVLRESRRLWSWKANDGIALSGLAQNGFNSGKVDTLLPQIYITGVCELIPCSAKTEDSIYAAK
jgi:hypothetical protein